MYGHQSFEENATFITSEHLQRRQDILNQNYHNLQDLILFAEKVIEQHAALTDFTTQVLTYQKQGYQLITVVQKAILNIMTLDEETDHQQIVKSIQSFGQDVINLWVESGSQLPYPQCPEEARSTRPSTNDDEISTEIATAVYRMYTELQDLVKKLSELVQHLDIAMLFRLKIEQWCQQTRITIELLQKFSSTIASYDFDLNTSVVRHDGQQVDLKVCREKQSEFQQQLEEYKTNHYDPLKEQLASLNEASNAYACSTVDISITQEPSLAMEGAWQSVSNGLRQYDQYLLVSEKRQTWYLMWKEGLAMLNGLHERSREWNNEKTVWVSKYDNENNEQGGHELNTLVDQCDVMNQDLNNYAQNWEPKLQGVHEQLISAFQSMGIPDNSAVLGTLEQADADKLFSKLKDFISGQSSEIHALQRRYKWESNVDAQMKLCQEKESETEHFIETCARWSPNNTTTSVDAEKVKGLHQATSTQIEAINLLLRDEKSLTSTESVFRRKANLEALKDRLQQHDAFLDEVVAQHQVLNSILDDFDEMEAKAESTKAKFLSMASPPHVEELQEHRKQVEEVCNSIEHKMSYPVRHYRDHDAISREKDVAHNKFVQDMIKVRQTYLLETGNTLEAILKSKERLSRRKAAEESYLAEAKTVEQWIISQMEQLQKHKENSQQHKDDLKNIVAHVNALHSSVSAYTSVHNLEVAANKYITLIQQQQGEDDAEEVASSVKLIEDKQSEIIDAWHKLSKDVAQTQKDLSFELRQAEFMELVSFFKLQHDDLHHQVEVSNLDSITEEVSTQWQNKIQSLESSLENIKSKVEKEWEAHLKDIDNEFSTLKAQVQARTSEANYFRLKRNFFEGAEKLTDTIQLMEESLNELSAHPVTIQGDMEHDSLLLKKTQSSFSSIGDLLEQQQEVYDEQRSFYRFLQLNKIPDLEQVDERQQELEKQWKQINTNVSQLKQQYITPLSQWVELHSKLNDIKQNSLNGVMERLEQFEHVDKEENVVPAFLDQDNSLLTLLRHRAAACLDIAVNLPQNGQENMLCFQAKYDGLINSIAAAEELLVKKKTTAQQEVDVMACQNSVKAICGKIQDQVDAITKERIQHMGEDLEDIYKTAVKDYVHRDSICQTLNNEIGSLKQRMHTLTEKYGTLNDLSVLDQQLNEAQNDLKSAMKDSNLLNDFARKLLGHNKSAINILTWLDNCDTAIQQLDDLNDQLDETVVSSEISSLKQKLNDFEKVVKQFQDMSQDLMEAPSVQGNLRSQASQSLLEPKKEEVNSHWESVHDHLEKVNVAFEKITRNANIARKVQNLTSLIDGSRSYLNEIPLFDYDTESAPDDDDKTQVGEEDDKVLDDDEQLKKTNQEYLATFPRPSRLRDIQNDLATYELEMLPQIEQEMKELAASIDDNDDTRAEQYKDLEESAENLKHLFDNKNNALQKSMAIGSYLGVADDIEILQTSLEEAINQSAPHLSTITGTLSRTDLHAKLIELDARFKYYEHKILTSLSEAQEKVNAVKQTSPKAGAIVADHLETIEKKWKWIKQQFKTRKIELSRSIEIPSLDSKESRIRKSSLPTRKASSLLRERADLSLTKHRLSPTASSTSSSSSSSRTTSTTRLPHSRSLAPPSPHLASKSATNLKLKPRTSTSTALKKPLNSYVADPHNDLDIEIGRIVNETPYRVKVKMVPGEVGRYWFGNLNPKLCYCRVLKSKMVMVRVGGGWTELTQFLRDHALLEGDFIPRHHHNNKSVAIIEEEEEPKSPTIQEGFIETHRADGGRRRPVTGSPSHSASTQAGYKEGDKFITVDSYGNQREVHMRKAPNHYMNRSTSTTTHNNKKKYTTTS